MTSQGLGAQEVEKVARLEGIEPPTDGLEIRCSIRLSYRRGVPIKIRPGIRPHEVGARGFEPPTPCSQSRCATGLRHAPEHNLEQRGRIATGADGRQTRPRPRSRRARWFAHAPHAAYAPAPEPPE